jgi:antitoxin HigA-1
MSTLSNTTEPAWRALHPGELIVDCLDSAGISLTEAARRLHVSRQTLHLIVAGQQGVTPKMAFRLGRLFGNGPGLWMRMQVAHDLATMGPELEADLAEIEPIAA